MSRLKDAIARRLSPELSSDADRFNRMRAIASDAYWWRGSSPVTDEIVELARALTLELP